MLESKYNPVNMSYGYGQSGGYLSRMGIGCPFILIDDRSEDFDYPRDFDRWLEYENSNLLP